MSYLMHYGVKGQKWGVRRYQNEDGSYTSEGKRRRGIKSKNNYWYPNKKQLATGAAIAGTILVAYGGYRLASNADLKKHPNYDKNAGFIKQTGSHRPLDDLYLANPFYMLPGHKYSKNCPYATMAYELRRRGYDVHARSSNHGMSDRQLDRFFNKSETYKTNPTFKTDKSIFDDPSIADTPEYKKAQSKSVDAIFKKCFSFGPNARGIVSVCWGQGGGHIFAFENDAKGDTIFMDAQVAQGDRHTSPLSRAYSKITGKMIREGNASQSHGDSKSYYAKIIRSGIDPLKGCVVRRTDNAEIDFDAIHDYNVVKNPSLIKRKFDIGV